MAQNSSSGPDLARWRAIGIGLDNDQLADGCDKNDAHQHAELRRVSGLPGP